MEIDKFMEELKEKFRNKNTWSKTCVYAVKDSVYDTIRSFITKNNLVIITKAEYDHLKAK